jgi:16S rRNA (uracil1498-N3)-methyltransferase
MAANLPSIMPGSIRLYVATSLATGDTIAASPQQAHYLGTVMRRGPGDTLTLFNGRDGEFSARIEALRRDRATFLVERQLRSPEPEPDL